MMGAKWMVSVLLMACLVTFAACSECNEDIRIKLEKKGVCNNEATLPCREVCKGKPILGRANCTRAKHCCWLSNRCVLKRLPNATGAISREEAIRRLQPGGGRSFMLNPSPPPFGCVTFPQSCPPNALPANNLDAPVNVPYCQRIPCLSPSNESLDTNFQQCTLQPGCYFDFDLFFTRNSFGQAVLPGVPVCHLAIRNRAFHRRVSEYVSTHGPWFPPITRCILDEYSNETMTNAPGCYMLTVLEHFGHKPKYAGWPGITENECYLIDGCWRENTCLYPMDTERVTVRSLNDNKTDIPELFLPQGQPKCQELDPAAKGGEFLDQYHSCLAAGCAAGVPYHRVREEITATVFAELPLHLQFHYFKLVQAGEVEPDNWRQIVNEILADNFTSRFFGAVFPLGSQLNIPEGGTVRVVPFAFNLSANATPTEDTTGAVSGRGFTGLFQTPSEPKYRASSSYPKIGGNLTGAGGRSFSFPGGGGELPPGVNLAEITSTLSGSGFATSSLLLNFFNSPLALSAPTPIFQPCPYVPYVWQDHPPLRGSYAGCCDQPLCYIPKSDLADVRSGVAAYLSGWTTWGECSKSCGGGISARQRRCVGGECGNTGEVTRPCNEHSCTGWTPWQPWGECTKSCGTGGLQKRMRVCQAGAGKCFGSKEQTLPCQPGACPHYTPWGQWTRCAGECGQQGSKTRRRFCVPQSDVPCDDDLLEEEEECVAPCAGNKNYVCRTDQWGICVVYELVACEFNWWTCRNGRTEQRTNKRCTPGLCRSAG